ncbi:MAG: hypothetical protein ACXWQR_06855 [Ktedonobacterales bacterium]
MRAMEHLQLDPVQISARSHDITLQSRVVGYTPGMWEDLTYQQRKFFDWGGWPSDRWTSCRTGVWLCAASAMAAREFAVWHATTLMPSWKCGPFCASTLDARAIRETLLRQRADASREAM